MSGLPFTRDQFVGVFAAYNDGIWPAQLAAYGLAALALAALLREEARFQRLALLALATMWLWTGLVYHWIYFAPINGAAWLFGALFLIEGVWFLAAAGRRAGAEFRRRGGVRGFAGAALILYAMILYPAAGVVAGDGWPRVPAFGVTPCPLTLFTLGVLLFARRGGGLWIVPFFWSIIGGSATLRLGMAQDAPLLLAGPFVATVFIVEAWHRRRRRVGAS